MTTTTTIDKEALKAELISQLESKVHTVQEEIDSLHKGVDLDEEDTLDPEDFSHQTEAGVMEQRLSDRSSALSQDVDFAKELPTSVSQHVELGAVIHTTSMILYVAVAASQLTLAGHLVTPISVASPLYAQLLSLNTGDSLDIGEHHEEILAIY